LSGTRPANHDVAEHAGDSAGQPLNRLFERDTRRRLPASSTLQLEQAWDAWQAERYRRGEISQRPGYAGNPFRPR
jgi:hypothetical protein